MGTVPTPNSKLRIHFFPYPTSGHFFPLLNFAATLSSSHNTSISATIITTPSNSHLIYPFPNLSLKILPLPPSNLPPNWDSTSFKDSFVHFHSIQSTLSLLKAPLYEFVKSEKPHCIVSDMFLTFTAEVALQLGIPRIVFHGMSSFTMSVMDCVKKYRPHEKEEEFEVPGNLPEKVVMRREQLPGPLKERTRFNELMEEMEESDRRSYGVLVNSFLELERGFGEFFKGSRGGKVWHVGPISAVDGGADDQSGALSWLESKEPGSVLYTCFGSQVQFPENQLIELAYGLSNSNHAFVWVIKQGSQILSETNATNNKKGLIIKGWAPQVAILNHKAIGGFLTHCGWNSVLEAVTAGKPMLTWPVYGDQPFNEKLVVDVLGLGTKVHDGIIGRDEVVKREEVIEGIEKVMKGGKEGREMRERARRMGEKARVTTKEGGSSWDDVNCLVQDLMSLNAGLFV